MALSATQTAHLAKLKARLILVESAYANALTAQKYGIAGRTKENVNFVSLKKEMQSLEVQIARLETNDGSTAVRPSFIPSGY